MASTDTLRDLVRHWAGTAPRPEIDPRSAEQVWPLLQRHQLTVALGSLLPAAARTAVREADMAVARSRTDHLLLELERILPTLEDADCHPVVLKGAALALAHYDDPGQRWFVDLDLLVDRDKVTAAGAALARCGYRPLATKRLTVYYDRHHLHHIHVNRAGAVVELHWALTLPASVYRHDPDGVRARALPAAVGRRDCRVAAPVDQVLHGVYQHVADGYRDLNRVLDLVRLLPALDAADWRDLAARAEAGRLHRALALWLSVAEDVARCGIPDAARRNGLGGPSARLLRNLDVAGGCLDRRAESTPGYTALLHLLLVPGTGRRLRELGRLIVPGEAQLLDAGLEPHGAASWPRRLRMGARGSLDVARTAARAWST